MLLLLLWTQQRELKGFCIKRNITLALQEPNKGNWKIEASLSIEYASNKSNPTKGIESILLLRDKLILQTGEPNKGNWKLYCHLPTPSFSARTQQRELKVNGETIYKVQGERRTQQRELKDANFSEFNLCGFLLMNPTKGIERLWSFQVWLQYRHP